MTKKGRRKTVVRPQSPSKIEITFSAFSLDLKGIGEAAPHAAKMLKNVLTALRRGVGTWYNPRRRRVTVASRSSVWATGRVGQSCATPGAQATMIAAAAVANHPHFIVSPRDGPGFIVVCETDK
jgi:hypothetical protein